jgi:hypothetical protein
MHGVDVDVVPDHPKMGPLIVALMRHLEGTALRQPSHMGLS